MTSRACSCFYLGPRAAILTGRYSYKYESFLCLYVFMFKKYTMMVIGHELCYFIVDCGGSMLPFLL